MRVETNEGVISIDNGSWSKEMTWEDMQENLLVDDFCAFWELSIIDILTVFGIVQYAGNLTIKEEPNLITVTIS